FARLAIRLAPFLARPALAAARSSLLALCVHVLPTRIAAKARLPLLQSGVPRKNAAAAFTPQELRALRELVPCPVHRGDQGKFQPLRSTPKPNASVERCVEQHSQEALLGLFFGLASRQIGEAEALLAIFSALEDEPRLWSEPPRIDVLEPWRRRRHELPC